ncbi:MAG: DUF2017 family protein [Jatrophihabitantaceae bacterium]
MKISPCDGDAVRVRLGAQEADTLASLLADLINALQPGGLDPSDPVYHRLYPDGYKENTEAAEAFRSMTASSLQEERLGRAEQCLAGLAEIGTAKRKMDVTLDAEAAQRWLQVLNDMRLAIGTRIGISEDDESFDFDPGAPDSMPRAIYAYLTGVQDALVRARMG